MDILKMAFVRSDRRRAFTKSVFDLPEFDNLLSRAAVSFMDLNAVSRVPIERYSSECGICLETSTVDGPEYRTSHDKRTGFLKQGSS
jgi:hypothetical protein